ncbi:MAG TPA: hypothetical protein VM555_08805 [Tahibacter sp.]|nr:hypothetical protein [Tahibacter sp.]
MQACNDATGVEILTGPELSILNSVAYLSYPLTCFFQPQTEHRFAFGEPWHALSQNACGISLGRLASLALIEFYGFYETHLRSKYNPRDYNFQQIYVRLTPRGGACWEQAFEVNWDSLVDDECDGPDEGGHERVLCASRD